MKITRYIPDTITSMNLLCGIIGVVFAFKGRFEIAFPMMLGAAVCDFCDGLAARALKAYSDLGKELDSLADMVSFGVLPSVMLYNLMKACSFGESALCFIPLLLAVFSGLRLAKFNIDDRQHESFLGLPTPAAAMLCGSLCYFAASEPTSWFAIWCGGKLFIPALTLALCALLVCEIPMFSLKKFGDRKPLRFLVDVAVVVIFVVLMKLNWSLAVLLTFIVYILKNIIYAIFRL